MSNEVSVCMIVKNEESNLKRCLESIKDLVQEIIIVDTGSTDSTVEIAKEYTEKIYYFEWTNNFSAARNESLKYATKDWILIMDADDEFCVEDKIKFKDLICQLREEILYYFETLSYIGDEQSLNINVNLNPRLFKNNYGYYYHGKIHNQIANSKAKIVGMPIPIKIYHYGYMTNNMKDQNKRQRNMNILDDLIKKEPENKFYYFNLGNEYSCLGDTKKALECYYKAFEGFNPQYGYSSRLLEKIVLSNYELRNYEEAIKYIDIGIKQYTELTDLYFLKGIIYKDQKKWTLAIKELEKCLELGEAPSTLKSIYGAGSFRALDELSTLYMEIKDYDKAYKYCVDTILVKADYLGPLYNIMHILSERNIPIEELKLQIEGFFGDFPREYFFVAHLFYAEGYYETSLEYINKLEESPKDEILNLKVRCLLRTGKYDECLAIIDKYKDTLQSVELLMCKLICLVIKEQFYLADVVVNDFKNKELLISQDAKRYEVCNEFVNIFVEKNALTLSENEIEKDYTTIIFEILDILLLNKEYDKFEKALGLLNLISDKFVLNELGKLYYKKGYLDMAKREFTRSIEIFGDIDDEGIEILKHLIKIKI